MLSHSRHAGAAKLSRHAPKGSSSGGESASRTDLRGTIVRKFHGLLLLGSSALILSGCGASDIASAGNSGNVTINTTTVTPAPTPTPTPTSTLVVAAAGCPTISDPQGLTDGGTISGPTGTYRACRLPAVIRASSTLPKIAGLLYEMNGRVNVGCDGGFAAPTVAAPLTTPLTVGCTATQTADTNVTLTIAPGAILYGATGQSFMAVNRGNRINATGTATQPIVFTSRDNVLGLNSESSQGQWGGVILLGRARTTDCNVGTTAADTCERDTEGSPDLARFGGRDDAYNAGTMSFVQIRYSGFVLGADRELQALTTEAIGTGTTLDHIQSHNSSDDGAEFFGGAFNFRYYIATGADDDSIDVDTGARANFQFVMLLPRPGRGDALFEIDSNGNEADTQRTTLRVSNFVAVQQQTSSDNEAADQAAALFRGNSDTTLANGIIVAPSNECIRINGSGTTPATLTARSVVLQCNATRYIGTGSLTAAQVATAFGAGSNNNSDTFTNTLTGTGLYLNGANENAVTTFDPTALSSFFQNTPAPFRIGAAWTENNAWYTGWTCNSTAANFGSTGTSCLSLPTT